MTKTEITKNDYFTEQEVENLLSVAWSKVKFGKSRYSFEKHTNYVVLATLLKTGLRVSELCSLTIPQIQKGLNESEFKMVGKGGLNTTNKAKIKKSTRLVLLNTELQSIIETYLVYRKKINTNENDADKKSAIKRELRGEQKHNFLFISRTNEPLTQQKVWSRFQTMCKNAGVTPRKTHATRHTTGMMLYGKTKDILTTSEILGHKDVSTTQIYVKATDQQKRKAIELI